MIRVRPSVVLALIACAALVAAPLLASEFVASEFVDAVEAAHGAPTYADRQALEAEFVVEFGGQKVLGGTMLFDTPLGHVRMELDTGGLLVFDGTEAWLTGPDIPKPRFHVLTWPYFLAAPFKLDDPGTHHEALEAMPWRDGESWPASELTFGDGVGDSPDDWYVLYRDPETDRLAGMGYIVTYDASVEDAEAEPHAISYDRYVEIDGVQLATDWTFWLWNRTDGVHGDPIGRVTIENPRFVTPAADAFETPDGARRAPKP